MLENGALNATGDTKQPNPSKRHFRSGMAASYVNLNGPFLLQGYSWAERCSQKGRSARLSDIGTACGASWCHIPTQAAVSLLGGCCSV